jgi:hypothetical protein
VSEGVLAGQIDRLASLLQEVEMAKKNQIVLKNLFIYYKIYKFKFINIIRNIKSKKKIQR